MRLFAVLVLTLLFSLPPATTIGSGPPSLSVRAQTQSSGVRLSLAMPHGPYAWNSIVPVTARLMNVSGHGVKLDNTEQGPSCSVSGPVVVVEVRQGNGTVVFPPSVPGAPFLPCPGGGPGSGASVRPGASITWSGYVILRAAHIAARVTLVDGMRTIAVSTPAVNLTLRGMPAPTVRLHTAGAVFADLTRPAGARGPLLAAWWWDCVVRATPGHSGGEITTRPGVVTAMGGTRLTPHLGRQGCSRLVEWHAVAGWSGFPAARVDYVTPRS